VIRQIRNSTKYVSYKDLKALMADLKAVYAAVDEPSALEALESFSGHWDKKYPKISASWRENWPWRGIIKVQRVNTQNVIELRKE
jgi:transposase-like protein